MMLEMALYMGFKVAIYTTLYGMTDPKRVKKALENHPNQVEVVTDRNLNSYHLIQKYFDHEHTSR